MLEALQIENVVLIDSAEISFGEGLNVLTGETGAGKSIIVDAISAIAGSRARSELVRTGEASASVTALFSNIPAFLWFAENDIEPEDDGSLIIKRKITAEGKNTCRVNGEVVSVSQLRELGALLIDIHGQNDGRRLLDEKSHTAALDAFGAHTAALKTFHDAFKALRDNEETLKKLTQDASERERRAELLRFQIDEIESANLTAGEEKTLLERRQILGNASKLSSAFEGAFEAMYGGEDTDGAAALLRETERCLDNVSQFSPKYAELLSRVRDMRYSAEDVATELRDTLSDFDFTPEELDETDARLDLIRRVTGKFGASEEKTLAHLEQAKAQLNDIEFSDERRLELEAKREKLLEQAKKAAFDLTKARRTAAGAMRERVTRELSQLAMPGVMFEVEFVPVETENGLSHDGAEQIRFLMSANAGEKPGRISRIASGGELSRIMLSLKNVLSESDEVGVVVFDEIDAGVSGIAAQRVGEKLSDLSRGRQVLCVTHLPQIAAMADTHFEISKSGLDGRTLTHITQLDGEGRVLEISRLTGGDNITETTKLAATEQLKAANNYKYR